MNKYKEAIKVISCLKDNRGISNLTIEEIDKAFNVAIECIKIIQIAEEIDNINKEKENEEWENK